MKNFGDISMKKRVMTLALAASLTGCVTFPTQESEQVQVLWDNVNAIENCELMGTVIGSEGHFYDYWLHADKDMVWGTLNQMRIKAVDLGADTLYYVSDDVCKCLQVQTVAIGLIIIERQALLACL